MADRTAFNEVLGNGHAPRRVTFSFYPNGTGTPTIKSNPGNFVTSVARTAQGKFTITLADNYQRLEACNATVFHEADNVDLYAQCGAVDEDASGGATVVVKLKTATVNTDVTASGTNRWVTVDFVWNDASA